jgi:hypothetical protein
MNAYIEFLDKKAQLAGRFGFDPVFVPDYLMDFQKSLLEFSLSCGRSAIFADCGIGKTITQLAWAENVVRKTNKPVLILTPLAVSGQTVAEAGRFGIEAERSKEGAFTRQIVVTNYERLHYFNPNDFAGVVCDESSILKNFEGATKQAITDFMKKIKYRLLCTATAAPNDYPELGTSSEALGHLGYMDMLGMFFKNDQNSLHPTSRGRFNDAWCGCKWRFKHHAEKDFWRWVCSWARACRKPSDLGFDDGPFVLPELLVEQTTIKASRPMEGMLFVVPAIGLSEQRKERSHTIKERCEAMAEKLSTDKSAIAWCHLNSEADLLTKMIPGAKQVSGKDSDDAKEEKFNAFQSGEIRALVTKPQIASFGLNWQHCNHMGFFPSHSFEQYYQAVRRCWRFGQKNPVKVEIITTEGESDVMQNLNRKAAAAEEMFSSLVSEMNNSLSISRSTEFSKKAEKPAWL